MRVISDGIRPVAGEAGITFDGENLRGYEGESLAACLTAAGKLGLRRAKDGAARGIFCGMGVCSECLVSVDGQPNQRACMTSLKAGMRVESQPYGPAGPAPTAGDSSLPGTDPVPERTVDVLVVGSGPAGLSAAEAAARAGATVLVVDERPAAGGQYFKQLAKPYVFVGAGALDRQFRGGIDLIGRVQRLGVEILNEAVVWAIFAPNEIGLVVGGTQAMVVRPEQLVLATGAYERGVPVPGWTLPGFMTTGAAQTLLRAYRVAPGRRVLVAGNGPLNLQVAAELVAASVRVAAVAELAPRPRLGQLGAALAALRHAPDLIRDGLVYLARLRRAGVPVLRGHALVEAWGEGRVEGAALAPLDSDGRPRTDGRREFQVDAICAGYGFMPSNDLSRPLGCHHQFDARQGALAVDRDENGQTTIPGVFVAGDCGGMRGARAAQEQGFIAGCAAARNLGKTLPDDLARERDRRRLRLASHIAFQDALWTLFAAPRLEVQLARDDTLVCRCEEVTLGRLREALATGVNSIGGLKRATRGGMGRCQGRYCGPLMARLSDDAAGRPADEFSYFAPQAPIKPVPIAVIARRPPP